MIWSQDCSSAAFNTHSKDVEEEEEEKEKRQEEKHSRSRQHQWYSRPRSSSSGTQLTAARNAEAYAKAAPTRLERV